MVLQPTGWFVTAWQGGVLLSLRQGWEVITSVFGNKLAQFIRCDDLDIVAPLIKVPCHFKPPTGFEADDEPAVDKSHRVDRIMDEIHDGGRSASIKTLKQHLR